VGAEEFGALIEALRRTHNWTLAELSDAWGRIPKSAGGIDKPLSETGAKRVLEGRRRLTRGFVQHSIEQLGQFGLNPDEAWAASGLLPPGVSAEELRQLRMFRWGVAAGTAAEALKHR
jgi:hypothetical protein